MILSKIRPIFVVGAVVLTGCSFATDALIPSLTGDDPKKAAAPAPSGQAPAANAQAVSRALPPAAPSARSVSSPDTTQTAQAAGAVPGTTFTGQKVAELQAELQRLLSNVSTNNGNLQELRARTVADSQRYHGTISAINARLQVGTTPGNPILVEQFNQALGNLDRINADIDEMNRLTTLIAADSSLAAFLAENTRAAFGLSGAVDEDHRRLAIIEDEVNRTVVLIERLLSEISEDIRRQTNYVSTERANLNTLSVSVKNGEILGVSLANRVFAQAGARTVSRVTGLRTTNGRRPLVVIRFDRANVAYEQALYNAVSRTLERRPNASFELVAVAPSAGGGARVALNNSKAMRNAENVLRALRGMGLPPSRVTISSETSATAQTNEVQLFVN